MEHTELTSPPVVCATLWVDTPDLTVCLQFFCARVGLHLDVVDTAEAVLSAAAAIRPGAGDFLIVDCLTPTTALSRATMVVT